MQVKYGDCLLVVENNGIGISVLEKLKDLAYPNLYYSIKGTHEYVEAYKGAYDDRAVPGFLLQQKTRPPYCSKIRKSSSETN